MGWRIGLAAGALGAWLEVTAAAAATDKAPGLALVERHCFDCHADGGRKGGVAFDEHGSEAALLADRELWHRVLRNVRAGLMPPPDKGSLTPEELEALVGWIKGSVFALDPIRPDPGRPVLRRLNRVEYRNTVRDLTGVDFRVDEEFPADDTGHGFDNIGEVLNTSPLLLEKYLAAAEQIVAQAVPLRPRAMPEHAVSGSRFRRTGIADGSEGPPQRVFPYVENAGAEAAVTVPHDGRYAATFELEGRERYVEGAVDLNRARLTFLLDGREIGSEEIGHAGGRRLTFTWPCDLTAGGHRASLRVERLTPDATPTRELAVALERVVLRGPEDPAKWPATPGYARWFPRPVPEGEAERRTLAAEIIAPFAERAFRRPVDPATIGRLTDLAAEAWSEGERRFESGVARAIEAILASPRFLFREEVVEPTSPDSSGLAPRVDEHSLAVRLSYFLWSTMPDETLRNAARAGTLRAELGHHIDRMIADERFGEFVRHFTGQWLQARDLDGIPIDAETVLARQAAPDPESERLRKRFFELRGRESAGLTPEEKAEMEAARAAFRRTRDRFKGADFSGALRRDMKRETERYVLHVMRENRPLTELVDSDYTFLNERLAAHYGIPGVSGDELRLVALPPDNPRGGLLTQGTVLAVTSNPTRTSPVKRGLFILDNMLGTPPPPPPPDVPALDDFSRGRGFEGTLRETLLRHRADPKCASCHDRMDPLGLAFEHFNAMGSWRDSERGHPIDATGRLLTGETFGGARELKRILATRHREAFLRCLTEKLLIYALGRSLTWQDETTIDQILARIASDGDRARTLLTAIVESDAFQRRR